MNKYKICSYPLQDGRWGPAFKKPVVSDGKSATFSSPTEFGIYFKTKEEADEYVIFYLKENGINEIDISDEKENNGDYEL